MARKLTTDNGRVREMTDDEIETEEEDEEDDDEG